LIDILSNTILFGLSILEQWKGRYAIKAVVTPIYSLDRRYMINLKYIIKDRTIQEDAYKTIQDNVEEQLRLELRFGKYFKNCELVVKREPYFNDYSVTIIRRVKEYENSHRRRYIY